MVLSVDDSSISYFTFVRLPNDFFSESLISIEIRSNLFSGSIPKLWTDESILVNLFSYDNTFGGTFPEWICNITTLQYLSFSSNHLQGSIPNSIEKLSQLVGCK